jgi:hypothetical protein
VIGTLTVGKGRNPSNLPERATSLKHDEPEMEQDADLGQDVLGGDRQRKAAPPATCSTRTPSEVNSTG